MSRPYFFNEEENILKEGYGCVVGIDEVGRGSFAGPLVVCATVYSKKLKSIKGINDSKLVSPDKRNVVSRILRSTQKFGVGLVWPDEIDRFRLSRALRLCIVRALENLSLHFMVDPDFVLLDGKGKFTWPGTKVAYFVGGDKRIRSIAASSIIAKVFRDNIMKHYNDHIEGFGFAKHVGYGTHEHRKRISKFGATRIHRKLFLKNEYPIGRQLPRGQLRR